MKIIAFSEKTSLLEELVSGAKDLADGDGILAVSLENTSIKGATRTLFVSLPENRPADASSATLEELVKNEQPAIVLIGATKIGKSVSARVASAFGTSALVDAKRIVVSDNQLQVTHSTFGGAAIQTDITSGPVSVVTVPAGLYAPCNDAAEVAVEQLDWIEPQVKVERISVRPKDASLKDVMGAKRLVCAGGGLQSKEDRNLVEKLAEALDGVTTCTRPLTEGEDALFYGEQYVGLTGLSVCPDLYIGVGVSGQLQHVAGIEGAKVTVAINNDKDASVFRYSDYGIVGDMRAVLPALIEAL